MHPGVRVGVALIAGVALLASACADARLDKLALGISKDSVTHVFGQPPHRDMSYFTSGRQWDIQLYDRDHAAPADSVVWRKMSPVIFIGGKAVGWGWKWWDATAAKQHLPMVPKG